MVFSWRQTSKDQKSEKKTFYAYDNAIMNFSYMPIYCYWGDDEASSSNAVEDLINKVVDPNWIQTNLTRLDGSDPTQVIQALEESLTFPFGKGDRVIVLKYTALCAQYSHRLADMLDDHIKLMPSRCHLIFLSLIKLEILLDIAKNLKKVIIEKSFILPPMWDQNRRIYRIQKKASKIGLLINLEIAEELSIAVGNDTIKLNNELEKLKTYSPIENITSESMVTLIERQTADIVTIGTFLLKNQVENAMLLIDIFLKNNEPPFKIITTLSTLIRNWLWVSLFETEGEEDIEVIAKVAGINNPRRIYILRKQIQGYTSEKLIQVLKQLLNVEVNLKRGMCARDAFYDGFLIPMNP